MESARGGKKKMKTNYQYRTLSVLLSSFQGMEIVVDLKNDTEIRGVLEEVDAGMNLTMADVVQTCPNGVTSKVEVLFLQGKMVRYVHIPDSINVVENLKQHSRYLDKAKNMYTRSKRK